MLSNRLVKHFGAAASAATLVGAANAAIVTWNCNLVVPNNVDGLYLNVETQVSNSFAALVSGWDLNPYGASTTSMSWYPPAGLSGCVTGLGQGGTTVAVASLSAGTVVDAASTFGNTASSTSAGGWMLNAANYFGFRFVTADGLTHYGCGKMTMGSSMGARTLDFVCYESTANAGITVIPAPGAIARLGLVGLTRRRRR